MVFLECTDSSFNDIGRKDDLAAETAAAERAALDQVVDLFVIDPELASEFMSPSLGERRTRTRPLGTARPGAGQVLEIRRDDKRRRADPNRPGPIFPDRLAKLCLVEPGDDKRRRNSHRNRLQISCFRHGCPAVVRRDYGE
jgi:hypothetical protein